MAPKTKFYIELGDNKAVYFPGEFLNGNLILEAQEKVHYKNIKIKFKGFAKVSWDETSGTGDDRKSTTYSAEEKYFKQKVLVMSSGGSGVLTAGRHVFPFQYQLPMNIPTSFEVDGGFVRYSVSGKIDRKGIFSNINTMVIFTVLDKFDLNYSPNAKLASAVSDSKTLCCCCCADGPIVGKVNIDKSGFVPGEFITVNAIIENMSGTNVPSSDFSIVQTVTQHATSKTRSFPITFETVQGAGCKARSVTNINGEKIQVPPLPPSQLRFCNIIDVQYSIQFCVRMPSLHVNLRVPCPIEIGSIPLYDESSGGVPPEVLAADAAFRNATSHMPSAPQAIYCAGTPVSIPTNNTYDQTATTFAPQYNYYDWGQRS